MKNYVDFFDKRIVALTSNKENIDKLTKLFKTKYELVEPTKPGFIVEHSSNIYILDKSLQVKKIIPNGIPSDEITVMLRDTSSSKLIIFNVLESWIIRCTL